MKRIFIIKQELNWKIKFNGHPVDFNPKFKMFFTSKLSNPHYPPELFIKMNIINFTVTQSGLSEQLLSEVFKSEKREQFERRDKAIEKMGEKTEKLIIFLLKIFIITLIIK